MPLPDNLNSRMLTLDGHEMLGHCIAIGLRMHGSVIIYANVTVICNLSKDLTSPHHKFNQGPRTQ